MSRAPNLLAVALVSLWAMNAAAHGIWAHVHVTGWAIENLPPGELRDFFSEPEVMNAALFGAAFTDTGYSIEGGELRDAARAYAEHTHWEPFVEDFVTFILENDPPPFDSLASRQRVAFLMGCAAHGLQDEIFDSLFLDQVSLHDGAGQEEADPGVDGFLALDGHIRFAPTRYIPMDTVLALYADLDEEVTEAVIDAAVDLVVAAYLNPDLGVGFAEGNGREALEVIPWTAKHYLDPDVPGSLISEVVPTMGYLQAIWDRLHGDWQQSHLVIHAFPEAPRRLRDHQPDTPDSWVTFVFGMGLLRDAATTSWGDADGAAVAYRQRDTRWGGEGWTRLVRLQAQEPLEPGGWYWARLEPGGQRIDGTTLTGAFELEFQVDCAEPDETVCPDLGDLPGPSIDPLDDPEPGDGDEWADDAEPGGDAGPDLSSDIDAGEVDLAGVDAETAGDTGGQSGDGVATGTTPRAGSDGDEGSGCGGCRQAGGGLPSLSVLLMMALRVGRGRRPARRT